MADYNSNNTGAQIDAAVDFGQNMDGTLTIHHKEKAITVSTSGTTTTDSNFFPANCIPIAIITKVTTAIGNNGYITSIGVGADADAIAGSLGDGVLEELNDILAFGGTNSVGTAGFPIANAAQNLTFTHNATPDAGVVYVDMYYYVVTGYGS